VFEEFKGDRRVNPRPFPRIPYDEAMLKYGSDKPDLRNPLHIVDVSEVFRDSGSRVGSPPIQKRQCLSVSIIRHLAPRTHLPGSVPQVLMSIIPWAFPGGHACPELGTSG